MRHRFVLLAMTILLTLGLAPAAAPASEAGAEPLSQTDNLEHVGNVQFEEFRTHGARATDSDFLEFTIPEDWTPPTAQEAGGVAMPAHLVPQPGETRVFNLMGTYNNGMHITDITVPEEAGVVSRWDCGILQADVFVFEQTDDAGEVRSYAAYTLDATANVVGDSECAQTLADRGERVRGKGTFIADVTDPYRPETVSFLQMRKGSHQTTVHPGGDYVYNSAAVVGVDAQNIGTIEVYDVSDPHNPELVDELRLETGLDSHDMTFSDDGERLFVAALTHSFVIDTSDPANPSVISRIFDPAINIHHDAHRVTVGTPAGERDFLLLGDELGGATPAGFCPGGGIHVYDITGPLEAAPVKVGAFFIPEIRATPVDPGGVRTCTAHVIQPLEGTTLLSVAWYNAGVRILDYSGLADLGAAGVSVGAAGQTLTPGIQEVGHSRFANSNVWSAKVHEVAEDGSFYIYGGDTARHLDIWKFSPDGAASEQRGSWLSPQEALSKAQSLPSATTLAGGYTPFCLLAE
jgi:hypothetical protein